MPPTHTGNDRVTPWEAPGGRMFIRPGRSWLVSPELWGKPTPQCGATTLSHLHSPLPVPPGDLVRPVARKGHILLSVSALGDLLSISHELKETKYSEEPLRCHFPQTSAVSAPHPLSHRKIVRERVNTNQDIRQYWGNAQGLAASHLHPEKLLLALLATFSGPSPASFLNFSLTCLFLLLFFIVPHSSQLLSLPPPSVFTLSSLLKISCNIKYLQL